MMGAVGVCLLHAAAAAFVLIPHQGLDVGRCAAHRQAVLDDCSQQQRLNKLDQLGVLVLNADYQPLSFMPLSIWSWQDAIKAVWQGRVNVVHTYEVLIRSATTSFELPSVVVLKQYERKVVKPVRFSRGLLFLRDEYRCQYCARAARDLTCDHVVPRSKGGTTTWTNTVAACVVCNAKKRNLSRDQLKTVGLSLVKEPFEPTPYQLEAIARRRSLQKLRGSARRLPSAWHTYLPINEPPPQRS
ncbi:hypothetical protein CTAYLR_002170 [Chrysophaeum taylorii]|uniref:HNH nuclease domain-containing protein n=1 Tax=Chrysophaeum taylorii TaxID=2483200 RepID=A0AAD7XRM1_9STRA|nr:hypothetical protein CTAYLR_002170 [Chrysophaeum taylorii]